MSGEGKVSSVECRVAPPSLRYGATSPPSLGFGATRGGEWQVAKLLRVGTPALQERQGQVVSDVSWVTYFLSSLTGLIVQTSVTHR